MRSLTPNEKFLLGVLALVVMAIISFLGLTWITKAQADLSRHLSSLKADQAEAQVVLLESDLWKKRMAWVRDHAEPIGDPGVAGAKLLEALENAAQQNSLEIRQQSVGDLKQSPAGPYLEARLETKGSLESVVRWITAFQSATNLYAITTCSIKVDADNKSILCTLEVRKYYKETNS